jgi:hypothetical protein
MASAQEDYNIPAWIKNNAAWWSEGQIDDASFVSGITYMIENGIMEISQSNTPVNNISLDDLYQENQEFREYFDNTLSDTVEYARNEQALSKENQRLDSLLAEYQDANDGFVKNEKVLHAQINSLQKQLATANQGTASDASAAYVEMLARTNPFIRSIIDDKINFYVHPVPYYAAPGVEESVKSLTDWMDKQPVWNQVYDVSSADLQINWTKDYGEHRLGVTYFGSAIEVGLGATTCIGDWAPFTGQSVYRVLWHEIGHSMGYDHSLDPNNIMYYTTQPKFSVDYDEDFWLDEGFIWSLGFCGAGNYRYDIGSSNESNGFMAYVITPDTDASDFINNNSGLYYPSCSTEQEMVFTSLTCNVPVGAKLLIHNPRQSNQDQAINIDVQIYDLRQLPDVNLGWDSEAFLYDQELLDYVAKFRK